MSDAKQRFRGGWTCVCLVTIFPLIEKEMIAKGIIKYNIDVHQWGYRTDVGASAGTHAEGGVLDVAQCSDAALKIWREWGVEMQRRTKAQGFSMEHGHGVVKGCTHRSNAAYLQHLDWEKGKNGLRSHGPITGPEPKGKNTPTWQVAMKTHTTPPVTPPATKPPVVTKPSWSAKPIVTLKIPQIPGDVTYLQAVVKVAGGVVNGKTIADIYVLAQDPGAKGNTRFLAFSTNGTYLNSMTVKNGGHGASFHAYRSAAGNLYIWTLIGDYAYRIAWQPGKTVTTGTKMAYGTARPVGTYESFVGFRAATDTHETLSIHDRFGWTDPKNNSAKAIKRVTIAKRKDYVQQTHAVSSTRIYRFLGKTNQDPGKGTRKHILDVFDWAGKLLSSVDLTAMSVPTTSDEPEGLTFTGTPGSVLAGKREGGSKPNRSYPIWQLTGLP